MVAFDKQRARLGTTLAAFVGRNRQSQAAKAALAAALLLVFGGLVAPSTVSAAAILTMLPFVAILAIASIGQHLVIQLRGFDLSVAGVMSFAAAVATALPHQNAGPWETIEYVLLALVTGLIVGAVNGLMVTLLSVPALVTTIGMNSLLLGATVFVTHGFSHQAPQLLNDVGLKHFIGVPITLYIMLVFVGLVAFLIARTKIGRRFVAISVNPAAAVAVGIPLDTYRVATYALAGFSYAMAGLLLAGYLLSPTIFCGLPYLLATVAAVVVGGNSIGGGLKGSVTATALGAFFLTYLGQLVLAAGFDTSIQYIVQALIVVSSVALPILIRKLTRGGIEPTASQPVPHAIVAQEVHAGITSLRNRPLMQLRVIRKAFGPVRVLKGVNLAVYPGEVHAIVGENGAGKSTLIAIAAGVLSADEGEIEYDGHVMTAPDPRSLREAGVSITYQHPTLVPDLTVLENLQLVSPALLGPSGRAEAARLLRQVASDELAIRVDRRVGELSLAERHIVEIARALSTKPKVLFFDEPTEPLQQADIRKLFELINSLRCDGVAVVYVSHRLHEISELADRISVMRDGEVIDSRMARSISMGEIITLIAGRPISRMFPVKADAVGRPILSVHGLSGDGFSDVTLLANAGEIVGLAGVEGEGQREFLRALAGVDRRSAGDVHIRGRFVRADVPAGARRRGIGFVPDDRHAEGLFLSLSLRENLGIGVLDRISTRGVIDRSAEIALSRDTVRHFQIKAASLDSTLAELSGGNQQKVLIGREMAANPTVLLVDEPTKGVDVGSRAEIYQRLRSHAQQGAAVVISSADGIELEGLCDRVLIFARGHLVRELAGSAVTDASITEANLTATVSRPAANLTDKGAERWHRVLSSDHLPVLILAILTAVILVGTNVANPYFLSAFNVAGMLAFLALLTFISMAQLVTIIVGAVDLSVGPLAGMVVVLASFLIPESASTVQVLGGSTLILLGCIAFGIVQGLLVTVVGLPPIIVTLASLIGLQGLSLELRPTAQGIISDRLSDAVNFPILGVPAGMLLTLVVVVLFEYVLYRSSIGRRLRAVGSSTLASQRLGISIRRHVLLAFVISGALTGIGGLMLAGQVGIGSALTGVDYTIMSITAVVLGGASVLGGRGSAVCTLMGGALVQATSSASSFINSDSSVHYAVLGIVTLLAAIFFSVARRHRVGTRRARF
jgi:ribose transport system ATP-binding protein